jgi:hypothetical protein
MYLIVTVNYFIQNTSVFLVFPSLKFTVLVLKMCVDEQGILNQQYELLLMR